MSDEKLNYFRKLDEENEKNGKSMIPLTFDSAHKTFFGRNPDYLKDFLISQLNLDIDPDKSTITLANVELPKELQKEYQKKVDILIYINNNTYVNVESNMSEFKDVKRRNFMYLTKIYSIALEKGENKDKLNGIKAYQLNINGNCKDKKYGEEVYEVVGKYTGQTLTNGFIIYEKNLEYYRNLYYTKHEKLTEDKMWLVLLSSKNFEEMYKVACKIFKDEASEFMEEIVKMNNDEPLMTKWEMEVLDRIQEYDTRMNALEEGKSIGETSGIEKEKREIARKLLKKKIDIDVISETTGLTKDEIKKLSN